jgi:hypothetical protein
VFQTTTKQTKSREQEHGGEGEGENLTLQARKSGLASEERGGFGVSLLPLAQERSTKERGGMVGREPNNAAATARWSGEGWNEARAGSVLSANCKGAFFSSFLHGLSRIFSSLFFFKFNSAPGTHASSTKKIKF